MCKKDWIKKQITTTIKDKRYWMTFGTTFAVSMLSIFAILHNTEVNASLAPDSSLESIEAEVFQEETETNNTDFIADNQTTPPEPAEVTREDTIVIKSGDTLLSVLTKVGMEYQQANDLYMVTKKVYDPRNLKVGQKLKINLVWSNAEKKLLSLDNITTEIRTGERVVIEKSESGKYTAQLEKDDLIEEINSASGTIDGTLSHSMSKQKVPSKLVASFIAAFSQRVDFRRDVKRGDKFEIIYENYITPTGEVVRNGNILFVSLTLGKNKIDLFRFKNAAGNVDFYDGKGLAKPKMLSRKPMSYQSARISSPFGRRQHPIYKDTRIHWGVDYAAPRNSLVYAGGDGVVQVAKYNGAYGNYVKIRHNSEYSTAYGHMQKIASGIRPGTRVKQGQVIGYVGSTGRSTGPHLHYEVVQSGKRVNPLTIRVAASENLGGKDLKTFKQQVARLHDTHPKIFAANKKDDEKLAQNTKSTVKAAPKKQNTKKQIQNNKNKKKSTVQNRKNSKPTAKNKTNKKLAQNNKNRK